MQKELLKKRSYYLKKDVPIFEVARNSIYLTCDLQTLTENLKQSHNWSKRELNSLILLKSPEKSVMLTAVHKGMEVSSFQTHDSLTLHLIEGKIRFQTHKNSLKLEKGEILTLHEKIQYKFFSMEASVFLLTLTYEMMQTAEINNREYI